MIKVFTVAAFFLFALSVFSQGARVDIASADKKTGMVFADASDGVSVAQAIWLGDTDKDKRISAETGVVSAEWREYSFSFTPKASGSVRIELMGCFAPGRECVEITEVSAKGGIISNGDFSRLNDKGIPVGWTPSGQAVALKCADGVCVKVNHDNRMSQQFHVDAAIPVTIFFKARRSR